MALAGEPSALTIAEEKCGGGMEMVDSTSPGGGMTKFSGMILSSSKAGSLVPSPAKLSSGGGLLFLAIGLTKRTLLNRKR